MDLLSCNIIYSSNQSLFVACTIEATITLLIKEL